MDNLNRFLDSFPVKRRAQHRMSLYQLLPRSHKSWDIDRPIEWKTLLFDEYARRGGIDSMKQHSSLKRRQLVNIFNRSL